ncbi:transposase [Burkholderia ubonensis]|uniref:transposase n=1 Tax=Burkholderia ubonensis TaxID=101571 RepID=UPI0009B2F35C|nr:transposase [Burkholderia ubonensis]
MRTWASKGAVRRSFSMTSTGSTFRPSPVSPVQTSCFACTTARSKSAQIVEFFKALRVQLRRKLMIMWYGAAQHKSRVVREYLDSTDGTVQMTLLPGYAPDLNPVEYIWAGSSGTPWPSSAPTTWPNRSTPLDASPRAARSANRSSQLGGSKLSFGDVMIYVTGPEQFILSPR